MNHNNNHNKNRGEILSCSCEQEFLKGFRHEFLIKWRYMTSEDNEGHNKGKRTLFRNMQNTSTLVSRQAPIYWLGSYVLIFLHSWS